MHELGIVFHIIRNVEEVALENNVKKITSVTLNVGEVSTVIPSYLEDCWNWACSKEEMMVGCKLICNTIKALTFCEDCKEEYETVKYGKKCPYCGSEKTYLLIGNEVEIQEICVE